MRSDIIEKLHKLIEHEKSASAIGNFAEAEAFAEKFRTLMEAHELTMADLGMQSFDLAIQDDFDEELSVRGHRRTERPRRRQTWTEILGHSVEDQDEKDSRERVVSIAPVSVTGFSRKRY